MKDFLEFADLAVPFIMIVDHDRISIYRADEELRGADLLDQDETDSDLLLGILSRVPAPKGQ